MAKYRQCYICGEILDHGERCDCQEREQQQKMFWQSRVDMSQKNGQGSFRFEPEKEKEVV